MRIKTIVILIISIIILFLINILYFETVQYDLLFINIFILFSSIYLIRNKNYTKTKTGVYFGILNFYIFGIIMTYNLSKNYLYSNYRNIFLFTLILFLVTYLIAYEFFVVKEKLILKPQKKIYILYKMAWIGLFISLIINLYINIISFGGILNSFKISYGSKTYLQNNYILYLYHIIIPSLLIVIWYGKYFNVNTIKYKFLKNLAIILSLIVMVLTKSRGNIVEIIFSLLFLYSIINKKNLKIRLSKKIVITILSFILIMYIGLIRNYDIGEDDIIINRQSIENNIIGSVDAMDVYFYVLETIPQNYNYLYGRSFFSTFVSFIPRKVWMNKPVSFGNEIMIYKYGNLISNYAVAPSYIGEWYANFGFFGVLFGAILLGIITKFIDSKKYEDNNVLWIVFLVISIFYFWRLMRGDFQSATIPYIIKIFYLYFLKNFSNINIKIK